MEEGNHPFAFCSPFLNIDSRSSPTALFANSVAPLHNVHSSKAFLWHLDVNVQATSPRPIKFMFTKLCHENAKYFWINGPSKLPLIWPSIHQYYFLLQHPYLRLFVSYFIIFCNFLVFAEDPVSHSKLGKNGCRLMYTSDAIKCPH